MLTWSRAKAQHRLLAVVVVAISSAAAAAAVGLLIAADQVEAEAAIDFQPHCMQKATEIVAYVCVCVRVCMCMCVWLCVLVCVCTGQCVNFKILTKMAELLLPLESVRQLI